MSQGAVRVRTRRCDSGHVETCFLPDCVGGITASRVDVRSYVHEVRGRLHCNRPHATRGPGRQAYSWHTRTGVRMTSLPTQRRLRQSNFPVGQELEPRRLAGWVAGSGARYKPGESEACSAPDAYVPCQSCARVRKRHARPDSTCGQSACRSRDAPVKTSPALFCG